MNETPSDGTTPGNPRDEHEERLTHSPEAVRATITLLQRRGIEAEVLIPLIRAMEAELGVERAHRIARSTIETIAREQGHAVAEALQRRDLEGFHHVKDTWSGAGGDLQIDTLREDGEALEFNVTGCRFAEMYRRMGASDLGFILSCSRDFALSEGYSQDLHLERTQTIMQGAPFCDFRYRLAEERRAAASGAGEPAGADGSEATDRIEERAAQIGGALGRFARNLAAKAKPEIDRRAQQARAAAEAARPHVERAAQQAREYVETHDEQIKRAAGTGARLAADRVLPPSVRPIVDAAQRELLGDDGPKTSQRAPSEQTDPPTERDRP